MLKANERLSQNNLVNISESYSFNFQSFGNKNVAVTKYNKSYFNKGEDILLSSILLIEDYQQHCLSNKMLGNIVDFFKDSVKNNIYIYDYFEKCKFEINQDWLIIRKSEAFKKNSKFEILGEFYFNNYRFTMVYGSYYFIQSIADDNETYMYYGD